MLKPWIIAAALLTGSVGFLGVSARHRVASDRRTHAVWATEFSAAQRASRKSGKPILVWVKGGSAAQNQRIESALAHPIVADAAKELVTVAVDADRWDAEELRKNGAGSKETSRLLFLSPDANFSSAVESSKVSPASILGRITEALRASSREAPDYLTLVAGEYNPSARQTAAFACTCYWKGEQELGRLSGVVGTRTGTLGDDEVVQVEFDPAVVDAAAVMKAAQSMRCFRHVVTPIGEPLDSSNQQQFHLSLYPACYYLPLTQLQATKLNSALVTREPVGTYLSPSQRAIKTRLERLLSRDPRVLDGWRSTLKVDRSPEGIGIYSAELDRRLTSLERWR